MVTVEIFPQQNACGCSSGSGTGTEGGGMKLINTLSAIKSKYRQSVNIEVQDYTTQEGIDRAVSKLVRYLRSKGMDKAAAIGVFALVYATPAVAINGHLAFINRLPEEAEFLDAIAKAGA
jgi:hypothetical protein